MGTGLVHKADGPHLDIVSGTDAIEVRLDGVNIEDSLTSLHLRMARDELVEVQLTLVVGSADICIDGVSIADSKQVEALKRERDVALREVQMLREKLKQHEGQSLYEQQAQQTWQTTPNQVQRPSKAMLDELLKDVALDEPPKRRSAHGKFFTPRKPKDHQ